MSPLYHGRCSVQALAYSISSGAKIKVALEVEADIETFEALTERRGKKAGQLLRVFWRRGEGDFIEADGWFAGWTRSHNGGAVIAISLHTEDWLKVLAAYDGDKGGPIELVLQEVEDTGDPIPEDKRQRAEKALKGGPLSVQCAKACNDIGFHRWIEKHLKLRAGIQNADDCASTIRRLLGVKSRAEIDHNDGAADKWRSLYRGYLATCV